MKKFRLLLFFSFALSVHYVIAQTANVGIGTANPTEKLDINGNINLTGTIKANGQDGTAGQVLMKNNQGALSWGSISEYKNFRQFGFTFPGASQNFVIPVGVTEISVEVWSGGGGGSIAGGGGGGGYVYTKIAVSAGNTLNIIVGAGGQGGLSGAAASAGGDSQISYAGLSIGVAGGSGASVNFPGFGGFQNSTAGVLDFISCRGQTGRKNQLSYQQIASSEFVIATKYGSGGVAPFQVSTGGEGGQAFVSTTTGFTLNEIFGAQGIAVGEGGGGGLSNGYGGAGGKVIVRW